MAGAGIQKKKERAVVIDCHGHRNEGRTANEVECHGLRALLRRYLRPEKILYSCESSLVLRDNANPAASCRLLVLVFDLVSMLLHGRCGGWNLLAHVVAQLLPNG